MSFDTMNKGQLRAACIEAGLPVDGLTAEEMRAALAGTVQEAAVDAVLVQEEVPADFVPEIAAVDMVPIPAPAVQLPVARPEANGVKMPAPGTICRQIWDHCESIYAEGGMPQAKAVRAWGAGHLDDVTMTVQYYRWRKYRGIAGRQA